MVTAASPHREHSTVARAAPLVFAILQILVPILPSLGFGQPIGDQSDSVRTLITPAGWAFSIWGALYTGSLVFAVYQALPAQRDNTLLARIRWPAAGAFLGNAVWALYTQSFGLSAVSAVIILCTLICLLRIVRVFAAWDIPFSAGERWCAFLPLSALASWLTVASVVNIAASLRYHGVEGGNLTAIISASVVLVAGLIAAAALISARGNLPYALVFLWALSAIYAAGGARAAPVAAAAGIAALLVIAGALIGWRRSGAASATVRRAPSASY
ncbi:MAG: hypothetical protein EOP62_08000 [Sphingomonadales bacterium]|nr:MAG: hypothetical protein EOP62_08000 [Sphingomonadales bacterium]